MKEQLPLLYSQQKRAPRTYTPTHTSIIYSDIIQSYANKIGNGVYFQTEFMAAGRFGTLRIGTGVKLKLVIPRDALSAPDQLIYMFLEKTSQLKTIVECGPDGLFFGVSL